MEVRGNRLIRGGMCMGKACFKQSIKQAGQLMERYPLSIFFKFNK